MNEHSSSKINTCRLCGGILSSAFSGKVLTRYQIEYYKCSTCYSLQTETPYWLAEAYSVKESNLDTGALQRNLNNFAACYTFSSLLSIKKIIDFGGKDGLLCRFLRDHLLECFVFDRYSSPDYAIDFRVHPGIADVDAVFAFEVFEHFANPGDDISEIFAFEPLYVLATTDIYTDQGADWWYLAKEGGQHVFFYSATALNLVAQKYGYSVVKVGGFILFYKPNISDVHQKIISLQSALSGWIFQAIKSYVFALPTPGVNADFEAVKLKLNQVKSN